MFETGVFRAYECQSQRQARRQNMNVFSIFFNMKVCYVISLESPHGGDYNGYKQYNILNIRKKSPLVIPNLQLWDFFNGTHNEFETAMVNECHQ